MTAPMPPVHCEPAIWARLVGQRQDVVPPDAARFLLTIQFPPSDQLRLQELANLSESGELTAEDAAEFDGYLHVGNFLAVLQSRARAALGMKLPAIAGL